MKQDMAMKKGNFIGKVNSLAQEFHYATPDVFLTILNIYCTSFHGSGLWDLFSKESESLFKSWNVSRPTMIESNSKPMLWSSPRLRKHSIMRTLGLPSVY